MSVDQISSSVPFVLNLVAPADVNGAGEVELSADNIVGPGVTSEAVEAAQETADDAQAAADLALASASEVWITVGPFIADVANFNPPSATFPAPVTGTITRVMAVADDNPDSGISVTASIAGTPVTNGAVSIGTTDSGVVKSATPTGANATTLGTTAVTITPASANGTTLGVMATVCFTKS